MTDAEKKVWFRIRGRQLNGSRFRRQVPIGSYIADFVCLSCRLVVEIDGGQHNEPSGEAHDLVRTEWLEKRGFRVIRFWDSQALEETDSVIEAIWNELVARGESSPT